MRNIRIFAVIFLSILIYSFCFVKCDKTKAFADIPMPDELKEKLTRKISLDLRDMDVIDVYKFLALKGDFNLSLSKNITGRVTLYLKSVSIRDAMDIISISNRLGYRVIGENIIHVMTGEEYLSMFGKLFGDKRIVKIIYLKYAKPAYVLETLRNIKSDIGKIVIDEDTGSVVLVDTKDSIAKMMETIEKIDHPLELKIYDLQYADAESVASKLRVKLDNKAVGTVQPDKRSNRLVVRAFPERLKEVDAIIDALDKKTDAVLIEVRILKLILKPQFDMGINWQLLFDKFKALETINIAGDTSMSSSVSTSGQVAVGNINNDEFAQTLKVNKQISETKVLANPSIMVVNDEMAKIHIGDKLAYVTTTTIGTGESQRVNEEIHYIDTGVQFTVTPKINEDGFVTMRIKPQISSQSGTLTTPQNASVPLINSTLVETSAIVKDGYTIVIGGLRQDEVSLSKRGIPILMDIPVFGRLFSNEQRFKKVTEIVILLTPHIVSGKENYATAKHKAEQGIKPDKVY